MYVLFMQKNSVTLGELPNSDMTEVKRMKTERRGLLLRLKKIFWVWLALSMCIYFSD